MPKCNQCKKEYEEVSLNKGISIGLTINTLPIYCPHCKNPLRLDNDKIISN